MSYTKSIILAILAVAVGGVAYGAGLLKATKFPATFQDLSFKSRMDILADGYEGVSEYDENGRCVSGCAYYGITLAEEECMIADATRRFADALAAEEEGTPSPDVATSDSSSSSPSSLPIRIPFGDLTDSNLGDIDDRCGVERTGSGYFKALCPPLWQKLVITSDFGDRYYRSNATQYHRGVDFRASTGTPVYAVMSGTVDFAGTSGNAGKMIRLKHNLTIDEQAVISRYLHLSRIDVKKGATVHKGQQIGLSGNTGAGTAAHLHFDIALDGVKVDLLASKIMPILDNVTNSQAAYTNDKSKHKNFIGNIYKFKSSVLGAAGRFGTSHRAKDAGCSCSGTGLQNLKDNYPGCQGCSD